MDDIHRRAVNVDQASGAVINADPSDLDDYNDRVRALDHACAVWLNGRGKRIDDVIIEDA